jgi:hypothetical protein
VKRQRGEARAIEIEHVEIRPVDAVDVLSLGMARLAPDKRRKWTEYEDIEPIYEVQYTHVVENKVTQQRAIRWDSTAELPIDYKDSFDVPKPGRSAGSWIAVQREKIREWDEES